MDISSTYKFIITGTASVGKSSITTRYNSNYFIHKTESTIGVEYVSKFIKINDDRIKLVIWDTAGQEIYRSLISSYYRDIDGVIIVFDLNNPSTFKDVPYWIEEARKKSSEDVQIILIGNKSDLPIRVSDQVIYNLVDQYPHNIIQFVKTSAKKNIHIFEIFYTLARAVYDSNKHTEKINALFIHKGIKLSNHEEQDSYEAFKEKCC